MRPQVVDLFAGAGLFSHAFQRQGFDVVHAIELDPLAAETYRLMVGDHISVGDVREMEPRGSCDVLIAGPPCQGFSTLGKRNPNDPRNFLSLEVVRWAKALEPLVVVVENVAAFLKAPVWESMKNALETLGYSVTSTVVQATEFGAPQKRERSFTLASRVAQPDISPLAEAVKRTTREAWDDLPSAPTGKNLHIAPEPSALALARMKLIPPGGDKRDIMEQDPDLAPASWWRLGKGQVTDAWGRMDWDEPSNTLRTDLQNPSKGRYIHPEQHRVISLREAARLHTIDDRWTFAGPRTRVGQQIGNSVPPVLGDAVARGVAAVLGF